MNTLLLTYVVDIGGSWVEGIHELFVLIWWLFSKSENTKVRKLICMQPAW